MKKLFLFCMLASGAAYGMNESATSSGADTKKETAVPAPAAPLDMNKRLSEAARMKQLAEQAAMFDREHEELRLLCLSVKKNDNKK